MKFNLLNLKFFNIFFLLSFCCQINATVINDIRIEGLQRVSAEVIFSVIPFSLGESIGDISTSDIIRSIFSTGNFENIEVGIDGDLLILSVKERPSISEIKIEGNKAIDTKVLLDGLKKQGMSEDAIFKQAILDGMRRELVRQYSLQGRYDSSIITTVSDLPNNRVSINIEIDEGKATKISKIILIGNKKFNDKDLFNIMELKGKGILNKIRGRNKYSREKLSGDLESIKELYLNNGYLQYQLQSVQVSVSP